MDISTEDSLKRFLRAMDGEWRVVRYSVDEESGRLRVHYQSVNDPDVEWTHNPHNDLVNTPKIGQVGRIGFAWDKTKEPQRPGSNTK